MTSLRRGMFLEIIWEELKVRKDELVKVSFIQKISN